MIIFFDTVALFTHYLLSADTSATVTHERKKSNTPPSPSFRKKGLARPFVKHVTPVAGMQPRRYSFTRPIAGGKRVRLFSTRSSASELPQSHAIVGHAYLPPSTLRIYPSAAIFPTTYLPTLFYKSTTWVLGGTLTPRPRTSIMIMNSPHSRRALTTAALFFPWTFGFLLAIHRVNVSHFTTKRARLGFLEFGWAAFCSISVLHWVYFILGGSPMQGSRFHPISPSLHPSASALISSHGITFKPWLG